VPGSLVRSPQIGATPAGRVGLPADVAGPALLLASPAGAFMTGSILTPGGGQQLVNKL
jgi:hypothetical protein